MTRSRSLSPSATARTDFDVLIIGAGISGIGAACHLRDAPARTQLRDPRGGASRSAGRGTSSAIPGIRSDSDLFTFGFAFKPWTSDKSIAEAGLILDYLHETVAEHGLGRHIRFGHRITGARWSSDDARWTVTAQREADGEVVELTCGFLFVGTRLLRLRPGLHPAVRGPRGLRGAGGAPAVLAGGPRLRRPAGRDHRQRRHRGHDPARDGRDRGVRDDAPALAELHAVAAGARTRSPTGSSACLGPRRAYADHPPQERLRPARRSTRRRQRYPRLVRARPDGRRQAPPPRRLRRRHPLHPDLRPLGPAHVPRARRRPLRGAQRRRGDGRHRPHRALHARRASGSPRAGCSRPTSSSRPPA